MSEFASTERGSLDPKNQKSLSRWMGYVPKFKHCYGEQPKKEETIYNHRAETSAIQCFAATRDAFAAPLHSGGGGPIICRPLNKYGKVSDPAGEENLVLSGHNRPVVSLAFSPIDYDGVGILASGSSDCCIRVWGLPDQCLDQGSGVDVERDSQLMRGHNASVSVLAFHPLAEDVLVSASSDMCTKIWDASTGQEKFSSRSEESHVVSLDWSYNGELLVQSLRDGRVDLFDPRNADGKTKQTISKSHAGPKAVQVAWLGDSGRIATSGQGAGSKRELKIWDVRKLESAVHSASLGGGSQVFTPHYLEDNGVLILSARGENTMKIYELQNVENGVKAHHCTDYILNGPSTISTVLLPRRACDVYAHEVARMVRLTKDNVENVSFLVPRAKDLDEFFSDDLYPDTRDGKPVESFKEWVSGNSAMEGPGKMSLNSKNLRLLSERTEEEKNAKKKAATTSTNRFLEEQRAREKREEETQAVFQKFADMATEAENFEHDNPNISDGEWSD